MLLAGLLWSSPVALAQPPQSEEIRLNAEGTAQPADGMTSAQREAMTTASQAELQAPAPVPAPVAAPTDGPKHKAVGQEENDTWKWGLGIFLGLVLGFILARILSTKPKVIIQTQDTDASTRRHRHQRGAGSNPASREEQKMSKSLNQEFLKGPMRANPANKPPREGSETAPARRPAPAENKPKTTPPTSAKAARPMNENTTSNPPASVPVPPSITELIDDSAALPAAAAGPVQFYAPAPDVPSIEHRKLSPNPLPQMPLLIKLTHPEATKAEYSFSPQADQSRIIGNGVRELKEFFAFDLPPTEQFTSIKNLSPGKLEKRDDTWHVVQKATIALS
ncbi:hypothetical protein GCM10023185_25750 [Hymenobacter saemangeumensis]|uniref:Uncharacterized protein n=1 Tax=Hymenobacter saemangeumensis TaxID=1084522 RepID=A0ABP8IIS2_9BACT